MVNRIEFLLGPAAAARNNPAAYTGWHKVPEREERPVEPAADWRSLGVEL